MTVTPLDAVRADDIAKYLAERNVRVYTLEQVSEMTGLALRSLKQKCRAGQVKHIHEGRMRGMTLRQIDLLLAGFEAGESERTLTVDDEMAQARAMSLTSASRAKKRPA